MLSRMRMHLALQGSGLLDRILLPGEREPASIRRNAEHRRVLAQMRRDARSARAKGEPADAGNGVVARVRESLGR
jgi:hypothetical protein